MGQKQRTDVRSEGVGERESHDLHQGPRCDADLRLTGVVGGSKGGPTESRVRSPVARVPAWAAPARHFPFLPGNCSLFVCSFTPLLPPLAPTPQKS